jgi:hypothetical protein
MSAIHSLENQREHERYEIRVKGHLDDRRADWFEGLTMTDLDGDETLLAGQLDQSALYGVLKKVRDLGMPLLSVARVRSSQTDL